MTERFGQLYLIGEPLAEVVRGLRDTLYREPHVSAAASLIADPAGAGVAWFAGVGLDVTALKPDAARTGPAVPRLGRTNPPTRRAAGVQLISLLCQRKRL